MPDTDKSGTYKTNFSDARLALLVSVCLVAVTLAVYWQAGTFDFINVDDPEYVTKNPHVLQGLSWESIKWALTDANYWHPLSRISHIIDYELYGMNAGGHHMTSVLFHTANTLLLFLVFRRMTGKLWQSAFVAGLFGLHPLHVESVAWVSERKDMLSTFFWLLTMWAYTSYAERPGPKRYIAVLFFFFLGLTAKPMTVTLPFVLLLLDYWPLRRFRFKEDHDRRQGFPNLNLIWEKIPFFALATTSSIATIVVFKGVAGSSHDSLFGFRSLYALTTYLEYLGKTIWPFGLALPYLPPSQLQWWEIAGTLLVLVIITVFAVLTARKAPYLLVGWLWYIGTLLPVFGLVIAGMYVTADRYTYVPLIGIFVCAAWGISRLAAVSGLSKTVLWAGAAAIFLVLIPATWKQVGYWENSVTLFSHTLNVTGDNYFALNSLGSALSEQGRFDEAIEQYQKAILMQPGYYKPCYNLGCVYAKQNKPAPAVSWLSLAVSMGFRDWELLKTDPDLDKIRESVQYREFVEKLPHLH